MSQKKIESKTIRGPQKCWVQKDFELEKIWVNKYFGSKKIWSQKNFVPKKFWYEKIFGQEGGKKGRSCRGSKYYYVETVSGDIFEFLM